MNQLQAAFTSFYDRFILVSTSKQTYYVQQHVPKKQFPKLTV